MSRSKKKNANPQQSMDELLKRATDLFAVPYDDRDGQRDDALPSLRSVAEQMDTTILRVRKLLITAEFYSTAVSRTVQQLIAGGNSIEDVMNQTGLKRASVYSYLPYAGLAFNLDQTTVNADRHRLFRKRIRAVEALQQHIGMPDETDYLWNAVLVFENYPFYTFGRGKTAGVKFFYEVKKGKDGMSAGEIKINRKERQGKTIGVKFFYEVKKGKDGMQEEEIKINPMEKPINRATVEQAYHRALEMGGVVTDPKKLDDVITGPKELGDVITGPKEFGVSGASYLYPMLVRFGVIKGEGEYVDEYFGFFITDTGLKQ